MRALCAIAVLSVFACERAQPVTRETPRPPTPPVDAKPALDLDLVLAIDLSKSMEEMDLPRDRLDVVKRAARHVVDATRGERSAIVIYAREAAIAQPLTEDTAALHGTIDKVQIGDVPELGTDLGDALATATDALADSRAAHKVVVMFTDGESNVVTKYSPDDAATRAKAAGVVVHTVLVGSDADPLFAASTDPTSLQAIAATTGGTFAQVKDFDALAPALQTVTDKLGVDAHSAGDAIGLHSAAMRALATGKLDRARELLERAVAADAIYAPAWRTLGLVHERGGKLDAAREAYRRYLAMTPNPRDADAIRELVAEP